MIRGLSPIRETEPKEKSLCIIFFDMVAFSKKNTEEELSAFEQFRNLVKESLDNCKFEEALFISTGDGGLLAVDCPHEQSRILKIFSLMNKIKTEKKLDLEYRCGIHYGTVKCLSFEDDSENIVGHNVNLAARIMNIGDSGHILVSSSFYDSFIKQNGHHNSFHDLGEYEIKHGDKIKIYNYSEGEIGNSNLPKEKNKQMKDKFQKKGIIDIFEPCDYRTSSKMITEAKSSIKILSYYGDGILNSLKNDIVHLINDNNVTVKLLLAEKDSTLLNEVLELEIEVGKKKENAQENKENINEMIRLEKDGKSGVKGTAIDEIEKRVGNKINLLEKHYYNTQIRYAIIIVDDERAFWTPYHPGIITEKCISFELIKKGEDSFFKICKDSFDVLWKHTEPSNDKKENNIT